MTPVPDLLAEHGVAVVLRQPRKARIDPVEPVSVETRRLR